MFNRNILVRGCQKKKRADESSDGTVNGARVYENSDAAMNQNYCVLEMNTNESHGYELCTNVNNQNHNALPNDGTYYNVTITE